MTRSIAGHPTHRGAQSVRDLVCGSRITPELGARLYDLRRAVAWRRRPWWDRLITRLLGGGP